MNAWIQNAGFDGFYHFDDAYPKAHGGPLLAAIITILQLFFFSLALDIKHCARNACTGSILLLYEHNVPLKTASFLSALDGRQGAIAFQRKDCLSTNG